MSQSMLERVREFHLKFGAAAPERLNEVAIIEWAKLRLSLMAEELSEIGESLGYSVEFKILPMGTSVDIPSVVDGICDLLYVTFGTAVTFGLRNIEPFFAEVHRANMAKEGGPTRADGKILKPLGWKPPEIERLLQELEP